jgi:transposase
MRVTPHDPPERLDAHIRAAAGGRAARRLMAVRLAARGRTAAAIAPEVLLSERQVRFWVARYNRGGGAALADRPGRGRKGPLTAEQQQRLRERLRAGPTEADGVCSLRGQDVRRILAEEFGVLRSLAAVYGLLHRLGFEVLRPRPRHPKADPAAQREFKKNSPAPSGRSRRPTPAGASRRGSRTSAGSARRGR